MRVLNIGTPIPQPRQTIVPWLGSKLALASPQGLDLGIPNLPAVPLERLRALVACVPTLQGAEALGLLMVIEGLERPLLVHADQIESATFGVAPQGSPEAELRQITVWLARTLPALIVDEATVAFVQGQPPRSIGQRLADLAGILVDASQRAAPAPAIASPQPADKVVPTLAPPASDEDEDEDEWPSYQPPPYWFDRGTGSLVYRSDRQLLCTRIKGPGTLIDLENADYDPQLVDGLKISKVPLRQIRRVVRDEALGRVEFQYHDGERARRLDMPHATPDTGEALLDLMQRELSDAWTRSAINRPRARVLSKLLLVMLLFTMPWGIWYQKVRARETAFIEEIAETNARQKGKDLHRDYVSEIFQRAAYRSESRTVAGTGTSILIVFIAIGAYKVSTAKTDVVELVQMTGKVPQHGRRTPDIMSGL